MTITLASPFKAAPRIGLDRFEQVLRMAGSPWADRAHNLYALITLAGHDPAVWLAICAREHTYGTNPNSVLRRCDTNSWTNARSVRLPGLNRVPWKTEDGTVITLLTGQYQIVIDPVRQSKYVRYYSVEDSIRDGMYRISDPTYVYVQEGRDTIGEVFARWTEDPAEYGAFVADKLNAWIESEPPMAAQIPGFTWVAADGRHHTKGRTQRIRGGAQHYTAGTNSLAWLTTSPNSDVSSTFLIKHNPTLEDRGWQLVRLEDTAHTTGSVVNPFTVSIEYEHMQNQDIPDIAYTVMARTWLDAAEYVRQHNLGEIPITRDGIKGHREWTGGGTICPDGIDVDRIVREAQAMLNPDPEPPPDDEWPRVPVTERDPWRDHLGGNPWGKDRWIPRIFVQAIRDEGFMSSGFVISEAFGEDDKVVQYFERKRWEWNRDGSITAGLVGYEAMIARYPERRR